MWGFLTSRFGDVASSSVCCGCSGGNASALELDEDPPTVTFGVSGGAFALAFFSGDCARANERAAVLRLCTGSFGLYGGKACWVAPTFGWCGCKYCMFGIGVNDESC